jgi:hypothetical protein
MGRAIRISPIARRGSEKTDLVLAVSLAYGWCASAPYRTAHIRVLFSVVSVVALWLFRERLLQMNRPRSSDVVAESIEQPGGFEAVQLRVAENYLTQFGKLAQTGNTMILPATLSDVGSMISMAMGIIKQQGASTGNANRT